MISGNSTIAKSWSIFQDIPNRHEPSETQARGSLNTRFGYKAQHVPLHHSQNEFCTNESENTVIALCEFLSLILSFVHYMLKIRMCSNAQLSNQSGRLDFCLCE